MRPSSLLGFLFLPAIACVPPVYQVQRSVRVPHAAAPLRTGQPLGGPVEIMAGMSNAVDLVKPSVGNEQASVEVPSRQVRGELRLRLGRGELAFIGERAFASSSQRLDPTQAPVGDGDVTGRGFAVRYAIKLSDPRWAIGLDLEAIAWRLPYVEHRTCVMNCELSSNGAVHDTTVIATLGAGVTPTFHSGRLTVFGGAFVRNHPTVERKGTETGFYDSEDVEGGPANLLVHAGLSYVLVGGISALVVVSQNVTPDPVQYGPGLGVALSATLR